MEVVSGWLRNEEDEDSSVEDFEESWVEIPRRAALAQALGRTGP